MFIAFYLLLLNCKLFRARCFLGDRRWLLGEEILLREGLVVDYRVL